MDNREEENEEVEEIEAEAEADAGASDLEDCEPLQVTPPQDFNPIFGTWGGGGVQIVSEVDVAERDVLLTVEGASTAPVGLLLVIALGSPFLCFVPAAAEWVHSKIPPQFGVSPLAMIVAVGLTALLLLGLFVAYGASSFLGQGRAQFTSQGVLRDRPGGSVFVPWEQITGYRANAEGLIALLGDPGILLTVPTRDPESRGQVLQHLDERSIPRVS